MKKIISFTVCCLMVCLMTVTAFAENSSVSLSQEVISLAEGDTSFEAVIEIDTENPYAGVEIGVECPEDMVVSASSSTCGSMSAGPTFARGLYWTTFFESDNKLSGPMNITLKIDCPESFDQGDIVIKEVTVLTKNGYAVDKETLHPDMKIHVAKENSQSSEETEATENTEPTSSTSGGTDTTENTEPTSSTSGGTDSTDNQESSSADGEVQESQSSDNNEASSGSKPSEDKGDVPNTGESFSAVPAVLLGAAAAVFAVGLAIRRKKKI